ncbi:MAG: dihydroorotate dehydrogenase electron transfer subunit [Muribaculaceae bacterium]|nr:dihydroorotate dehydrogenase electron transfer subunit [Muribaculaceae bacterium]
MVENIEYIFKVIENRALNAKTRVMRLQGDGTIFTAPGQFINIKVEGKFLRRPISVCDYSNDTVTILYDVVGDGTAEMSEWECGREVNILAPLGNGFDINTDSRRPLLLGGGIGIAPLYRLAKDLIAQGKEPCVILGFNSSREVCWADQFRAAGAETYIATVSGEEGTKGFVTDVPACKDPEKDYFYACGPMPMLRALCEGLEIPGEISLEARMACGFGVCMCCSLATKDGAKRICKDGPVFKKEELIWK